MAEAVWQRTHTEWGQMGHTRSHHLQQGCNFHPHRGIWIARSHTGVYAPSFRGCQLPTDRHMCMRMCMRGQMARAGGVRVHDRLVLSRSCHERQTAASRGIAKGTPGVSGALILGHPRLVREAPPPALPWQERRRRQWCHCSLLRESAL